MSDIDVDGLLQLAREAKGACSAAVALPWVYRPGEGRAVVADANGCGVLRWFGSDHSDAGRLAALASRALPALANGIISLAAENAKLRKERDEARRLLATRVEAAMLDEATAEIVRLRQLIVDYQDGKNRSAFRRMAEDFRK